MTAPRILIIDDDPDFVEITKTILETKQYDVTYAHSQAQGVARLEEQSPDLVILDIMMGRGAEGFILARKMKKDARYKDIPIIMITSMPEQTGFDFPGDPIHPQFLPVTEYLEKPVEPQVLLDRVESLLPRNTESRPG
jgi:twitching motility two-component system response regulator PilH